MKKSVMIRNVSVNDTKAVRTKNEAGYYKKLANSAKPMLATHYFDSVAFYGSGAEFLVDLVGEDIINEIMAGPMTSIFLQRRFLLDRTATIQDLFDRVPVFSKTSVTVSVTDEHSEDTYILTIVKEWPEKQGLGGGLLRVRQVETIHSFED